MRFKVLIVGAGKIGALYDKPESRYILTHAHAFSRHKKFHLLGFVDSNNAKAKKACRIWGGKAFYNIETAFKNNQIDVVCIACPDEDHFKVLKNLSSYPIRLVFVEKPLAKTISEGKKVLDIYKKNKIPILVNYSRRFIPEFEKMKNNIKQGVYGDYLTGIGCYGKGLLGNGSHLIDFLQWFIGKFKSFKVLNYCCDYTKDDPSVSASLTFFNGKPFILQCIDCRFYTVFEINLFFEKMKISVKISVKDSGLKIEEYKIKHNDIFKNYKILEKNREYKTTALNGNYYAVENIFKFLTQNQDLKCNAQEAFDTLKFCCQILDRVMR